MPDYKDVDELRQKLREEFFPETDEEEETEEEVEVEEEEVVEEDEEEVSGEETFETEEEEVVEEEEEEVKTEKTPATKEDKASFAFKKLREEADSYKKKAQEYETKLKDLGELNELAVGLGYKDYKEMVDANKRKLQDEEAKRKGIDPAIYRELQDLKLKAEQAEQREKTMAFVRTLDEFVNENGLTADDKEAIVKSLDADGWELSKLFNYPNPKKLLKGYAADLIVERKTQKVISEKKKKFAEKKFTPEAPIKEDVIDAEVAKKLKAYAARNNYKY